MPKSTKRRCAKAPRAEETTTDGKFTAARGYKTIGGLIRPPIVLKGENTKKTLEEINFITGRPAAVTSGTRKRYLSQLRVHNSTFFPINQVFYAKKLRFSLLFK